MRPDQSRFQVHELAESIAVAKFRATQKIIGDGVPVLILRDVLIVVALARLDARDVTRVFVPECRLNFQMIRDLSG